MSCTPCTTPDQTQSLSPSLHGGQLTMTTTANYVMKSKARGGPDAVIVGATDLEVTLPFGSRAGESVRIITGEFGVTVNPGASDADCDCEASEALNTFCNGDSTFLISECNVVDFAFIPDGDGGGTWSASQDPYAP